MRKNTNLVLILLLLATSGCAAKGKVRVPSDTSYWKNEPQIEVGRKNIVFDTIGNITGIPAKVFLLNTKVENHSISPKTIEVIQTQVQNNSEEMAATKIRLNQFAPVGEFKRLVKNKKLKWWWRVFPGIPVTVVSLGGRVFGGDHYNPYTDTINIYSDVPTIALHEAGHSVDYTHQSEEGHGGLYAVARLLTPVTLYQEYVASEYAIDYLKEVQDREDERQAYKTLYPAYGTYVGAATGLPFANAAGAGLGHIVGITPRRNREKAFKAFDEAKWSDDVVSQESLMEDPESKKLLEGLQKTKMNPLIDK